jgi:hypothetical protein
MLLGASPNSVQHDVLVLSWNHGFESRPVSLLHHQAVLYHGLDRWANLSDIGLYMFRQLLLEVTIGRLTASPAVTVHVRTVSTATAAQGSIWMRC